MAQFDLKKATVTFEDGGSESLQIKVANGTLRWTEKKAREYLTDRGRLSEVRDGDQEPLEVSFDITWEFLTASSGGTPTPEDVLKNRGEAADWVTSAADECEPFAIDIQIVYDPDCGSTEVETITISDFRYESLAHNFKEGTISVSGKANVVKATAVRS